MKRLIPLILCLSLPLPSFSQDGAPSVSELSALVELDPSSATDHVSFISEAAGICLGRESSELLSLASIALFSPLFSPDAPADELVLRTLEAVCSCDAKLLCDE